MSGCPSQVDLQRYVEGRLSAEQNRGIVDPLEGCGRCRADCEHLRADEALAGRIRTAFRSRAAGDFSAEPTEPEPSLPPSHAIEGYVIQEEVARGGMGVVYKAVQESTNRVVALKVMLEGPFSSTAARRRFQREVELAATLEHPNIVPIFDSGQQDDHRFFAMQYVDGAPLNRYLEAKTFSVRQRLELFRQICSAVNYAHLRGVIHRDLKPSNVMVDGRGHPYVLDFGLAKVTMDEQAGPCAGRPNGSPGDVRHALVSLTGQVLGTLPYMSPEQVSGRPLEVDVRTDVYSLGVILFEMLTDGFPYEVGGSLSQTLHNITEASPRSLAGLTKDRPNHRRVDRELEAIVLTTLAKEKERRYQNVGALAADIERYLRGEAIEARRDSRLYVLRKALSRYRAYVVAAALVFVAVCAVSVVSLRMYVQVLELNRSHARAAALEAELAMGRGRHREALEKAEQALQHDPHLCEAQLLRANALLQMGRSEEATAYLEHILQTDPQSWAAHYALAEVRCGDPETSRYHQQRVLELRPDTAEAYYASSILATDQEAVDWLTKALASNPMHYESRVRRAMYYMRCNRWDQSLTDAEIAVRLRPGDYQGWWWKGEALLRRREYGAALPMLDEAAKLKAVPAIYYARATIHRRLRQYHQAIDNYNQALKISPPNPSRPWNLYHRATLYWIGGDHQAALRDYDQFAALHPAPFWSDARRVLILIELDRAEEAQEHLEQTYARTEKTEWLARVFEYLLDQRSSESLLALADTDGRRCEANYYIAERKYQGDDLAGARRFYEACLATGVDRYIIPVEVTPSSEYELSEWRLASLRADP